MSKICPNCGQELKDDQSFCTNCGEKFEEKQTIASKAKVNSDYLKSKIDSIDYSAAKESINELTSTAYEGAKDVANKVNKSLKEKQQKEKEKYKKYDGENIEVNDGLTPLWTWLKKDSKKEHFYNETELTLEENQFIRQQEFAELVKASDNYFVIITRENLYNLPYSVEEIYGLYSSGKYQNTKQIYQEMYHIYPLNQDLSCKPDKIIVEDTNSGYEYFKAISKEKNIVCESAGGKTKIFAMLEQLKAETESICVIADGAAIGPEMDALYKMSVEKGNIKLYLPESFEWIILSSELLEDKEIKDIMDKPENYIESQEYFSWERFFTKLLVDKTAGTYLKYQKGKLNPTYLHEKNKNIILRNIKNSIDF